MFSQFKQRRGVAKNAEVFVVAKHTCNKCYPTALMLYQY